MCLEKYTKGQSRLSLGDRITGSFSSLLFSFSSEFIINKHLLLRLLLKGILKQKLRAFQKDSLQWSEGQQWRGVICGVGGPPKEWVTQPLSSARETCFQGVSPKLMWNDLVWSPEASVVLPQQCRHCVLSNSQAAHTGQGVGTGSSQAEQNQSLSLKLLLFGSFLILNDLNIKFPNPSREFIENTKGTQITIKRRQSQPKAVSFQFYVFLPNNRCLSPGGAQLGTDAPFSLWLSGVCGKRPPTLPAQACPQQKWVQLQIGDE